MKPTRKLLLAGLAAFVLPLVAQAALPTWGTWTAVTNNTAIQTTGGYTTYGGVNFNGSTTTINNGSQDVAFTGIAQNASGSAAGITVGSTGFAFQSTGTGNSNVVSAVGSPQTWATVLDRVIGDDNNDATINLSGLTSGSTYYVQFFSSAPDTNILANSKIASGGVDSPLFGNHAAGGTKSIIATFTADGGSQSFAITGTEPTYSALVIGVQPAGGDTTPPDWTATWPQVDPLSSTSLTVRAKTNETGTAYYVVLPDGATAPTAAQVKAGNDSANAAAIASGNLPLTASTEATDPATGLTADTSYDVYFIAEDAVPNLQATPVLVDVTLVTPAVVTWGGWTAVTDETAIQTPGGYTYGGVNFNGSTTTIGSVAFTGIAQNASGVTNAVTVGTTGFAFQSTGSGNSNVVSAVGSPQTWETVLDRVIGDDNNSASIDLTGLTPGTTYTVQFFSNTPDSNINGTTKITSNGVESAAFGSPHAGGATKYIVGSFTATATSQSFAITGAEPSFSALVVGTQSSDVIPPTWTATWPQAEQLSATSITVSAQTNENGTAYYVVLPDGATAPSAAQVKLGQDSSSAPATASGSLALTANTEATDSVTGLTANTSYDVYFVAEDAVSNLQATPVLVNVTLVTYADVTWGSVSTIVDDTSIVTSGVTGLVGANFAPATSPITANGVTFTAVTNNSSALIGGGITVGTSGMAFTANNGGNSIVTGDFGTIMDTHTGIFSGTGTITLSGLVGGTQYQIQFFASTNETNAMQNETITGGANTSDPFGLHAASVGRTLIGTFTASGTTQVLTITGGEAVANALTIGVVSAGNTFANWIDGYDVGGLTAFGDDADFDGLDNGLENFLGTAPNVGNAGLKAGALSGQTFTFTHPQNATPASDVSAPVYTWSTNLVNWNADNSSSGGITVDLNATPNTPVAGTTTVTATVTGTVPAKLFVRLGVSQN